MAGHIVDYASKNAPGGVFSLIENLGRSSNCYFINLFKNIHCCKKKSA